MKRSASMDKVVIDGKSLFGRTAYISREGGNGLVMVTVSKDSPDVAVMHDLIVHENMRGNGLGDRLVDDAIEEAGKLGADRLRLSVEPLTWTEEWYERRGFMFTGFKHLFGQLCSIWEKDITRREPSEPQ